MSQEKREQVIALGRLGWSLRRIEMETGIRRETASAYLKAAGVGVRPQGRWGRRTAVNPAEGRNPAGEASPGFGVEPGPAQTNPVVTPDPAPIPSNPKPAKEASPDPVPSPAPNRALSASACEPHRDFIELYFDKGRNAKAIYQDLVDDHGFRGRYQSVKRFVRHLRGSRGRQACPVIVTPPGEEAQVDYGSGPMVRDAHSGRYRRTRMFVLILGYSRKAVRLLAFQSNTRLWAELHEQAFRRLGGATRTIVLDNLGEGVLKPDVYDPALNPLYRDMLAHYGAVALPFRVRHPDRKGKGVRLF